MCKNKILNRRIVARAMKGIVNEKNLSQEYARVLHESLLIPTLMYGKRKREFGNKSGTDG